MSEYIERAAEVIDRASEVVAGAMFGLTTPSMLLAVVTDLYAEDLLVTPEHDAAVAAKALRDAAEYDHEDHATEIALGGIDYVRGWLAARADRIEREATT